MFILVHYWIVEALMLSIAYVLPAQVTHEVKASAGITFLKVVDLVSSVSDVIFFLKYDC